MLDCDQGLGLSVAADAMRLAIAKASVVGMGTVVAGNGRHFGAAAYHAHLAADAGVHRAGHDGGRDPGDPDLRC